MHTEGDDGSREPHRAAEECEVTLEPTLKPSGTG